MTCTTPLLSVFISKMLGPVYSRERHDAEQAWLRGSEDRAPIDRETGLALYIQDFPTLLSRLDVDVLALFGEKDRHVDWRKTRALYALTLGANRHSTLTVGTTTSTSAKRAACARSRRMTRRRKSDGYYETRIAWLETHVLQPTSSDEQRQQQQ